MSLANRPSPRHLGARVPWLSIVFSAIIILVNVHLMRGAVDSGLWWLLACDRVALMKGELWRLVLYSLPHTGAQHLVEDVAYLLMVGALAEHALGRLFSALAFSMCALTGAAAFAVLDLRHAYLVGSSDGTHGLLACVAVWLFLSSKSLPMRAWALAAVGYLFYTSVYAIHHGVMGWPLTMLPNGGYDHLGGVSAGVAFGVAKFVRDRYSGLRTRQQNVVHA